MRGRAASAWARGWRASLATRSFVHAVQYAVGLPVLAGRPSYLWWSRRTAARGYRALERLVALGLRASGGERRAVVAAAREMSTG